MFFLDISNTERSSLRTIVIVSDYSFLKCNIGMVCIGLILNVECIVCIKIDII